MNRRRDQYIQIARRYYIDEVSQQQIAKEFGLSRPTVASILKRCKETGIVEIRIQEGSPGTTILGEELKKRYGLNRVVIVPAEEDDTTLLSRIGKEAAQMSQELLHNKIRIGIAWGTTLYQMVHQMHPEQLTGSSVIQLMGGLGAENPQYDGSELARELSRIIHADYYPLQCPVIVNNSMVKDLFIREPSIMKTLDLTKDLDIAFVGLSSNDPKNSALVRSGFLSFEEARQIQASGAVGHICGYSYDAQGKLMDIPINQRIIGIAFEDLLAVPERVGVACGLEKAEAIRSALLGGQITSLITDELVANRILS